MEKELVKKWIELGIIYAIFAYDCGGDSMGDTNVTLFAKGDGKNVEIKDADIEQYINDLAYEVGDFYVDSDGYYIGEHGEIKFELPLNYLSLLNDENVSKINLDYSIDAYSDYSETETETIKVYPNKLDIDIESLLKYVDKFSYDYGRIEITYIKDSILPNNLEKDIKKIVDAILYEFDDFCVTDVEVVNEFEFDVSKLTNETVDVQVSYSVIETRPKD